MIRLFALTIWAAVSIATAAHADSPKLRIDGDRLIYDTQNVPEDIESSIIWEDIDVMMDLLKENPQIKVLELNSGGGYFNAAAEMSTRLIDFDLHTHVNGECSSVCIRVFLAGKKRTMERGSLIGLHQLYWNPQSMQEYYDDVAQEEGWDTPFEFASWLYSNTQTELHEQLLYMVRRGVEPIFAIEALERGPDEMWYPWRARLLASGVLTE